MISVKILIFFLLVTISHTNPIPTVSPESANAYLRSFLPWWPNNTDFSLTTVPPPSDNTNYTRTIGNLLGTSDESDNQTATTSEEGGDSDSTILRVQDIPSSPLDELRPDAAPKSFISDSINHNDGNFIINFDEMGECPRDCSSDLREAMNIVLQDMSHVERYHRICEKYLNASTCVNEDARCDKDDRGMFEMMTSGLHYMCVEQELAFNATIKCIDDEAGLVQSECDTQCQTRNLFMNWMMRTAMQDTIQQGVNGIVGAATGTNPNPLGFLQGVDGAVGGVPNGWADMLANVGQRPPNPQDAQQGFENFRQFTNDLCRIGDCMLDCIRSKFNTRCEGSAGTLLSEVFVRPIAASQNKLSILRPILGSFMPEQCNYLHNNADLKKHRIDATMDEELKRMYAEKMAKEVRERTEQDELLSNLVPLDENGVPLPRALPELKSVDSPLDVSVKTLDQLILDMYSKNETTISKTYEKNNVTVALSKSETDEKITNSTLTTTEKPNSNITDVEVTTVMYESAEKEFQEASGEASGVEGSTETILDESSGSEDEYSGASGEASGTEPATSREITLNESSGAEVKYSEAPGETSESNESSGIMRESSGDNVSLDDINMSGEASSGEVEAFESSDKASGSGDFDQLHRNSKNSTKTAVEEQSSGFSGESSGDESSGFSEETMEAEESSGQKIPQLTPISDDSYIL